MCENSILALFRTLSKAYTQNIYSISLFTIYATYIYFRMVKSKTKLTNLFDSVSSI